MISLGWYTDFVSRPYESLNYFLSFLDLFCNDYLHIFTVLLHKQTNTMLYWIYAKYRMLTILGRPGFEHHTQASPHNCSAISLNLSHFLKRLIIFMIETTLRIEASYSLAKI